MPIWPVDGPVGAPVGGATSAASVCCRRMADDPWRSQCRVPISFSSSPVAVCECKRQAFVYDPDWWTVVIPPSCSCKQTVFFPFLIGLSQVLFSGLLLLHWEVVMHLILHFTSHICAACAWAAPLCKLVYYSTWNPDLPFLGIWMSSVITQTLQRETSTGMNLYFSVVLMWESCLCILLSLQLRVCYFFCNVHQSRNCIDFSPQCGPYSQGPCNGAFILEQFSQTQIVFFFQTEVFNIFG